MSKEKRRVPKLRFPGFTEDWEQRKADYIFESVTDKGYPELPVLSASQELGMVYRNQNGIDIQHDKKNEASYKRVLPGQFVIHLRSFQGGFAYSEIEGITSPAYTVMSFKNANEQYGLFWKHVFKSETFIKRLETITYGIRDGRSISFSDFKSLILRYPSFLEQKLIGDSLAVVEKGITLHQRKLEHLNLKKKALLQKLFPKNGERYPELRFPGFTDAWEQRKLGDFTNQINTFVNPEDAKLPLWSLTAEAGLIEKSDRYERDFLVKKKDQFKRIETNTLVYNPMNITIGSIDIYTGLYPIAVSGYYVSIVYDKNIDTDFLKEVLLLPSSLKMYKNYATGSLIERQRVQYPTFSKLQLLLPNLDEQKAIGQLFKSLNLNITLHQRKLEHLQLQKKALLQQMFV